MVSPTLQGRLQPPVIEALDALELAAVALELRTAALVGSTRAARGVLGLAGVEEPARWLERVHPHDRARVVSAVSDDAPVQLAIRLGSDGQRFADFQLLLRRSAGLAVGLLVSAPSTAASAEPELAALLEALPFDVWERDADGYLVRQNATALSNWGAALGRRIDEMALPPDTAAVWREMVSRALGGEVVSRQIDYATGAKTVHTMHVLAPVREAGRIRGVVGVNLDITATRAAEAERDQSLALERAARAAAEAAEQRAEELVQRLSRSLEELERAQKQLVQRERFAALGELAAVVAHEVRNPLGVIFNVLSELRRAAGSVGEGSPLFQMLDEEASRLNRTVGDLLNFVRPLEPQRQPTDLAELTREAVELALRTRRPGAPEVRARYEGALTQPVPVDPALMRVALTNVALNALQAMPEGGELAIALAQVSGQGRTWASISIHDSGRGIAAEVLPRLFQPFVTTRASGTGLGLAFVQRIVEVHDGAVEAMNGPGAGATVTVLVPT